MLLLQLFSGQPEEEKEKEKEEEEEEGKNEAIEAQVVKLEAPFEETEAETPIHNLTSITRSSRASSALQVAWEMECQNDEGAWNKRDLMNDEARAESRLLRDIW